MLNTSRVASCRAYCKEEKAMKLPRNTLVWCVLIVCLTLLVFTWITRRSLCELSYRDHNREVTAQMAYESDGK
jgi:protein HokB